MPLQCKLFFFNCVGIQTVLNTLPQIDSKTVLCVHCTITLPIDLEFFSSQFVPCARLYCSKNLHIKCCQ